MVDKEFIAFLIICIAIGLVVWYVYWGAELQLKYWLKKYGK